MKSIDLSDASSIRLREDADTRYDDAEEMYSCYGAHITGWVSDPDDLSSATVECVAVQAVPTDWLRDGLRGDALTDRILSECVVTGRDNAVALADLAERVWEAMVEIEDAFGRAVAAYDAGDLDGCVDALQEAQHLETEHGHDPSTSDLADRLLTTVTRPSDCPGK
jgi:hypothetical protein